jgi:hypothetical protein
VRLLGRQGLPVRLLAFDVDGLQGSERAAAMAKVLLERRERERASLLLVLTGNVQASTRKGVSWDPTYTPVGYLLARAGVRVKAFDTVYRRGTVWDCLLDPGARAGTPVRCGAHRALRSDGAVMGPALESEVVRNPVLYDRSAAGMTPQKARLRMALAYKSFGAERFLFVPMAPNQYPPGFDGYFYVPQLTASSPVHGVAARAENPEVSR